MRIQWIYPSIRPPEPRIQSKGESVFCGLAFTFCTVSLMPAYRGLANEMRAPMQRQQAGTDQRVLAQKWKDGAVHVSNSPNR